MDAKHKAERPRAWLWLVLGVVMIWAVAGFGTFFFAQWFDARTSVDLTRTGTFGDTFGAVNSLFSALGVAGVAYALILQYREQRDARLEAKETKEHQTELAMLSSIIHACSAILDATARQEERAGQILTHPNTDKQDRALARETSKQMSMIVAEYRARLVNLMIYAERKWNWKASSEEGRKPVD